MAFFQTETKFVVGKCYEMIRVKTDYRNPAHKQRAGESYDSWGARSDEVGDILSDQPVYLGIYVKSQHQGTGDGRTRYDTFFNNAGRMVVNELLYDGTTRYRECQSGGKRKTRSTRKNRKAKRSKKSRSKRN